MKKLFSLIKACMTSDMQIFKIKTGNNKVKNFFILGFISLCFMSVIWTNANIYFEKLSPLHLEYIVLSLFVFIISFVTLIEGIYKTGSLFFNCKDDQLLLSLPIKKSTVLFIRIFKFYIFELLFNSMLFIPLVIAYLRWAPSLSFSFFLSSFVMLLFLPIIPIAISSVIGLLVQSISSRFKLKNVVQIIFTMLFLVLIIFASYNMDNFIEYVSKNATSINDLITKIYYPAGIYATLTTNFKVTDLLIFTLINVIIFVITIFILSKFYFKINSRIKKVITNKKVNINKLHFKRNSQMISLIKKEINTFVSIPVFIINAGFGLVLFAIGVVLLIFKYDSITGMLTSNEGYSLGIYSNVSILLYSLIIATAFMTSITNSLVSLEGRNINILKSLPLKTKTILMSKIYAPLVITTPIIALGDLILFIYFKINIIECILLLILSIVVPLLSHLIGLIVNLLFPKLDFENPTEVVKQSSSSFIAVMIGMILLLVNMIILMNLNENISSLLVIFITTLIYVLIDLVLYIYLIKVGTKKFDKLSC